MSSPLIAFSAGCRTATLVCRMKRFFVECLTPEGTLWAHTNNSGSMLGLTRPGTPVLLSPAPGAHRKLHWTLELVGLPGTCGGTCGGEGQWVGVNTMTPNRLLAAAFHAGRLPWAEGYTCFRPEAKRGHSRLDALLTGPDLPPLWVECKNVTLVEDDVAAFPDAVSERAQKHVREMRSIVEGGERAAFFFCVQRPDGRCFGPADYVDPVYAALFYEAVAAGVESHAHRVAVSPAGLDLGEELPLVGCERAVQGR